MRCSPSCVFNNTIRLRKALLNIKLANVSGMSTELYWILDYKYIIICHIIGILYECNVLDDCDRSIVYACATRMIKNTYLKKYFQLDIFSEMNFRYKLTLQ